MTLAGSAKPRKKQYTMSFQAAQSPSKYIQRHGNLCKYVHMLLSRNYNLLANRSLSCTGERASQILWNLPVQKDHTIRHNKPDILLVEKHERHAIIIDIAGPSDYNIIRKRAEKIRNYQDLSYKLKQIGQVDKITIVPVIIGATVSSIKNLKISTQNLT